MFHVAARPRNGEREGIVGGEEGTVGCWVWGMWCRGVARVCVCVLGAGEGGGVKREEVRSL